MDRVTVEEAAQLLGIKEESVRKRVSRGKLRADKDEDGRLLVYVDSPGTVRGQYADRSVTDRDELLASKDRIISILEHQLSEEREARRRADTIIAQLSQANAALATRVPELEAAEGHSEGAEGAAEGQLVHGHTNADTGDSAEPRSFEKSWWRRVFGG